MLIKAGHEVTGHDCGLYQGCTFAAGVVDLRPESPTYLQHVAVELDADTMRALYVPERFAHGYQVLEDQSDASYEMSASYTPSAEGGLPHDDPRLALPWPLPVTVISAKDRNFRPLAEIEDELKLRMSLGPAKVSPARRLLAIAARPDHRGKRLQQNVEVEPDRPVADVVEILRLLRLDIAVAARRHLPKSGEARGHARAQLWNSASNRSV